MASFSLYDVLAHTLELQFYTIWNLNCAIVYFSRIIFGVCGIICCICKLHWLVWEGCDTYFQLYFPCYGYFLLRNPLHYCMFTVTTN